MKILMSLSKALMSIGFFLLMFGWFSGCNDSGKVIFYESTDVLQNPYPLDYPSAKPIQNKVIAVLNRGDEALIITHNYGKDYLAYKVRLADGRIGYVIYKEGAFRIMPAPDKR